MTHGHEEMDGRVQSTPISMEDGADLSRALPSHSPPGQPPGGKDLPGAAQELRGGCQVTNKLKLLPAEVPSSCENCQSTGCCLAIIRNNNNNIDTDFY